LREHVVIRRSAEGAHQSSSLLRYIKSADEHNGMLSNALFGRGSDNSNACRATSHSGGVWKYCMSNALFGRGSNHFNALFGRGFGEYVVTLVKLRNGCMRQACSAPDTSFVSLPAGGRNLQPTLSVDNAFEGKRQPSSANHHPAGDGGCCYASASAAAPSCSRLHHRHLLLWPTPAPSD